MITEDDLVKIFAKDKRESSSLDIFFLSLNRLLMLVGALAVVYFIINFSAFSGKISYWYKTQIKAETYSAQTQIVLEPGLVVSTGNVVAPPKERNLPTMQENYVKIPVLNIDAPITWRVNNVPADVSLGLENGLIHINGTALPGEKGNIYVTGHSSNYIWAKGNYNSIFATLDQLIVGDLIYVKFNGETYVYKVSGQKVVVPTDLSVFNQTDQSKLTLVTCWPIGTSLKRLVVEAKQIDPDPANNKKSTETINMTQLPAGR
ncbi:MAG: sortase [Candidatus Berkelbacteria bacterium]